MIRLIKIFSKKKPELHIKIQNETEINHDFQIQELINEFITRKKKRKLRGKELKIIIPENYKNTLYELSSDEYKQYFDDFGLAESKGTLILPTDKNATEFIILLNPRIFESEQYYSTIPHEITHVFDYTDYFNQYGNVSILDRSTKDSNYYFEHYLWTEFNAKKIGIQRYQKELEKKDLNINLEISTKYFIEDVNRVNEYLKKLYFLMHHFGRMSVYDDGLLTLDNLIFPKDYLIQVFGMNVMTLYHTIRKINNYHKFNKEKEYLKFLMSE